MHPNGTLTDSCSDTETLLTPFTEETVYNSDGHVATMLIFARSDAHAMEEVTFLFIH